MIRSWLQVLAPASGLSSACAPSQAHPKLNEHRSKMMVRHLLIVPERSGSVRVTGAHTNIWWGTETWPDDARRTGRWAEEAWSIARIPHRDREMATAWWARAGHSGRPGIKPGCLFG